MTIPYKGKREIPPTHPGEMIREDFMPDYDLNIAALAEALRVSRQTVNKYNHSVPHDESGCGKRCLEIVLSSLCESCSAAARFPRIDQLRSRSLPEILSKPFSELEQSSSYHSPPTPEQVVTATFCGT